MKKYTFPLLLGLLGAGFLTACSGDDSNDPVPGDIIITDEPESEASFSVAIAFNGDAVTCELPHNLQKDVTITNDKGYVTITNQNTTDEVEFVLSGATEDGGIVYVGQYKCTLVLNGLNVKSNKGAALDIQCGKRVAMVLTEGTENNLQDAASGSQKAALYCKGHLEVSGAGTLNVTGNSKHAISTKEYMQLKKSTGIINIKKAASDAMHVGQYFQMSGGVVNIDENTASDGIQVETIMLNDDVTPDPEEENNGQIIIKGGTITQVIKGEDCKAIKCDNDITISGGMINIKANGNGSRGIQTDGNMVIGEEDSTTEIYIEANGARCQNSADSEDPHRCMGIKVDGNLTANAGTVTVKPNGAKSRGIKVGGTYTNNGASVTPVPVN